MSEIILDFGSGNTCRNDAAYVKRMIDELKAVDTGKHEIIIKYQLFKEAPPNIPLEHQVFDYAYKYAKKQGYKTTSSVNDLESLEFLLRYEIPFVKIANRRELDWLIGEVPRKIPVYISVGSNTELWPHIKDYTEPKDETIIPFCCVSKYPATIEDYEKTFISLKYLPAISDHTIGFDFWHRLQWCEDAPKIWERHFKLPDSTGPDAGPFAVTPEELREIL